MRKLKLSELNRPSLEDFRASPKFPVMIVLDNIRSAHNVGSIFRTADAFNVEQVILTGITAQPPHREIQKTAIGATESVDWSYVKNPSEAIRNLRDQGFRIYPVEQTDQSLMLGTFDLQEKAVFVFGNEVDGVSNEVLALCEMSIEIPQHGTKHSFNVATSVGIVLWEYQRQHN